MANGLYSNSELAESIITDLNNLLKNIAGGQYIRVCSIAMEMVQKLMNLKNGIEADINNRDKQIKELQERYNELAEQTFGTASGGKSEGGNQDGND